MEELTLFRRGGVEDGLNEAGLTWTVIDRGGGGAVGGRMVVHGEER